MKTRPSIQFDAMSGTAGEVTARSTRFGTILSGRARQPGRVTPQQKDMRALFARVGRSFKRLTPAQIDAWSSFAQQYSFGSRMEAKSPAVNAYVTLNCNRALLGLDMLKEPPTAIPSIPAVEYRNIIVTPPSAEPRLRLPPRSTHKRSGQHRYNPGRRSPCSGRCRLHS